MVYNEHMNKCSYKRMCEWSIARTRKNKTGVKGEKMDNSISKIQGAITRNSELFEELASLYKIFGDASRVKILCALTQSPMCVSEISAFLSISQSAVSHQLRILKTSNLVKTRREGKNIIYRTMENNLMRNFKKIFTLFFNNVILKYINRIIYWR